MEPPCTTTPAPVSELTVHGESRPLAHAAPSFSSKESSPGAPWHPWSFPSTSSRRPSTHRCSSPPRLRSHVSFEVMVKLLSSPSPPLTLPSCHRPPATPCQQPCVSSVRHDCYAFPSPSCCALLHILVSVQPRWPSKLHNPAGPAVVAFGPRIDPLA
jgi:hypothetical protein